MIGDSLAKHGANYTIARNDNLTTLHIAVRNGNKKIVDSIIASGVNVNVKDSREGSTPLILAAQNGEINF